MDYVKLEDEIKRKKEFKLGYTFALIIVYLGVTVSVMGTLFTYVLITLITVISLPVFLVMDLFDLIKRMIR